METLSQENATLSGMVFLGNVLVTVVGPAVAGHLSGEDVTSKRAQRALRLSCVTAAKTVPATVLLAKFYLLPLLDAKVWGQADWVDVVAYLAALLAVGDAAFYFLHRLMHCDALYWLHAEHHTFFPTMTVATNAIGVLDAMVSSLFGVVVVPTYVVSGAPPEAFVLYIAVLLVAGNHIHNSKSNLELFPFQNP